MTRTDIREAVALCRKMLLILGAAGQQPNTIQAAELRRAIGVLDASAETAIKTASIGGALTAAFTAARAAGATIDTMDRVRSAAQGEAPVGVPATIIAGAFVQLALVSIALILADLDIQSREQVESFRDRFNAAFEAAEEDVADARDSMALRALTGLHAAFIRDLIARARPLPTIVAYRYATSRPALWIANRLYGDGGRYIEIVAENRRGAPHPAFMPAEGRALSR